MDAANIAAQLSRVEALRAREHAATVAGASSRGGTSTPIGAAGRTGGLRLHLRSERQPADVAHRDRRGIQPAYGHLSLLRTATETAARARWILDPSLGIAARIARGVAAERASYEEREKFERAVKAPVRRSAPAKSAADRLRDLEQERVANGIPRASVNVVEAVRDYLVGAGNGEAAYRLLSAFAHGRQWSLLASERIDLAGNAAPRTFLGQVTAREDVSLGFTTMAVETYAAVVTDLETYFGVS